MPDFQVGASCSSLWCPVYCSSLWCDVYCSRINLTCSFLLHCCLCTISGDHSDCWCKSNKAPYSSSRIQLLLFSLLLVRFFDGRGKVHAHACASTQGKRLTAKAIHQLMPSQVALLPSQQHVSGPFLVEYWSTFPQNDLHGHNAQHCHPVSQLGSAHLVLLVCLACQNIQPAAASESVQSKVLQRVLQAHSKKMSAASRRLAVPLMQMVPY